MCQLIEVTWFIWKLSADQLIILLDRDKFFIMLERNSINVRSNTRHC